MSRNGGACVWPPRTRTIWPVRCTTNTRLASPGAPVTPIGCSKLPTRTRRTPCLRAAPAAGVEAVALDGEVEPLECAACPEPQAASDSATARAGIAIGEWDFIAHILASQYARGGGRSRTNAVSVVRARVFGTGAAK